jgi:[ribosomal protein S5]-alanine N-acetyltransferase
MIQAPEIFTTPRLILRRSRLTDAEAVFEYASDPKVIHYMDYRPRTDISDAIQSIESHPTRWAEGKEFTWIITVKPDDRAIGTIACCLEGHMADFGYLLNRRYWGNGYATEAGYAVVTWLMSVPEIYRVWATCDSDNLASVRVLEKIGLMREGILRRHTIRPNISPIPRDAFIYAKVR